MKPPAFQFYARDFLVSTLGWPNEDVGVYLRLLLLQWDRGGLPEPEPELRMLVGSRRPVSPAVMAKFPLQDDGQRRNERLERSRSDQETYRLEKVAAGRAGGRAKAANRLAKGKQTSSTASEVLLANAQQNVALQSASASAEHPLNPPQAGDCESGAGAGRQRQTAADRAAAAAAVLIQTGGEHGAF